MRLRVARSVLAVVAVVGLAACTPGSGGGSPSSTASSASPGTTATIAPTPGGTPTPSGTSSLLPDETESAGNPMPSVPTTPGQGEAELSIIVKASPSSAPESYTLVCMNGAPAAESHHPSAAAACAALKKNPALLNRPPRPSGQLCDQRYGGPQTATVSGSVDGVGVDASYKLTDGCEIAAWNAVADILGSSGAGS
ncbi:SSI family serine proteinase inhibitor [bacterium RCC_150]